MALRSFEIVHLQWHWPIGRNLYERTYKQEPHTRTTRRLAWRTTGVSWATSEKQSESLSLWRYDGDTCPYILTSWQRSTQSVCI